MVSSWAEARFTANLGLHVFPNLTHGAAPAP
jgi:hypothetical protein